MSRKVLIPHITRLELPEARQAIPRVHAYLREKILDGTFEPGTKFSQVSLAEQLGVSRTPLREVLRMLQEEGLVEIERNQRARISTVDPSALDEIYAQRVALESLGVAMTVDHFSASAHAQAAEELVAMREAAAAGDTQQWFVVHSAFHRTITSGTSQVLQKQLGQLADRCVRYIRIYQGGEPNGWHRAGDREHTQILAALVGGETHEVTVLMAQHLARTALKVLKDTSPEYVPTAVPAALAMIGANP